jgi:hypothetical protein
MLSNHVKVLTYPHIPKGNQMNAPFELPSGVDQSPVATIHEDGRMTVTVDEKPYSELVKGYKQLLVANNNFVVRAEQHSQKMIRVNAIREEFRQSVEENEIEDTTTECFSIDDVNRIFEALYMESLEVIQEHNFEVTVTVTASVSRRGYNVDSLRDELQEEVENMHFEIFADHLDREFEVGYTSTDVDVTSE